MPNNDKNIAEAINDHEIQKIALDFLREHGKNNGLNELEQIRALHLETNEFTCDNNFLTPTLKMKRTVISKHYSTIIDQMYSKT